MSGQASAGSPPQSGAENELETLCDDFERYNSSLGNYSSLFWLSDRVLERLRLKPFGAFGVLITGLVAGLPPLVVAFGVAASAGQWNSALIWRWVVVSLWIGVTLMLPRLFHGAMIVEHFAMVRALTKATDLRRLAAWNRRWGTTRKGLVFGAAYALVSLVAVGLFAGPRSLVSVPAGSIAMLAIVFAQMGEITYGSLLWVGDQVVCSELDYRVYWPSPLDSPWVRPALRGQAQNEFERGVIVTGHIIAVAVLLSLKSPLLLPATIALISTGYAAVLASIAAGRMCLHRIAARAKEARLVELRTRIDVFGERPTELNEAQFGELIRLFRLYDIIDRSPTSLRARDSVARLLTSLAVPSATFVITVVAQEYFGRWAGKFLP